MSKMGRPTKPKKDQKACVMTLRLNAEEARAIEQAAKKADKKRSEWARSILTAAANVMQ